VTGRGGRGRRVSGKNVSIAFNDLWVVNPTGMFRRFESPIPRRESEAMMMKNIFIVDLYLCCRCGFGGGDGGCENGRGDEEVREPILHRCL